MCGQRDVQPTHPHLPDLSSRFCSNSNQLSMPWIPFHDARHRLLPQRPPGCRKGSLMFPLPRGRGGQQ